MGILEHCWVGKLELCWMGKLELWSLGEAERVEMVGVGSSGVAELRLIDV